MSEVIDLSPAILIPACASSSLTFRMMYSAYKLNKQGNNVQPWCAAFPVWNQSVVQYPLLTIASWPAYRLLRKQVRWSGIPISWRMYHSQRLWHSQWSRSIIFLEFSCFFYDLMDVGNLISDFSAFSKSILNIWKFLVHVLLKPSLENFEHCFVSVWVCEMRAIVW